MVKSITHSMPHRRLMLCTLLLIGTVLLPKQTLAQEEGEVIEDDIDRSWEWAERNFVIVKSTADYEEAMNAAVDASANLDVRLDLRDLTPNADIGLTWSDSDCVNNGWEPPCYVARGRFDNGVYVSIEYSNAFEGFAEGYYIVIVASGADDANDILTATLRKARTFYADAYMKRTRVYMGCMH